MRRMRTALGVGREEVSNGVRGSWGKLKVNVMVEKMAAMNGVELIELWVLRRCEP
jgi:hypothetical protein